MVCLFSFGDGLEGGLNEFYFNGIWGECGLGWYGSRKTASKKTSGIKGNNTHRKRKIKIKQCLKGYKAL